MAGFKLITSVIQQRVPAVDCNMIYHCNLINSKYTNTVSENLSLLDHDVHSRGSSQSFCVHLHHYPKRVVTYSAGLLYYFDNGNVGNLFIFSRKLLFSQFYFNCNFSPCCSHQWGPAVNSSNTALQKQYIMPLS